MLFLQMWRDALRRLRDCVMLWRDRRHALVWLYWRERAFLRRRRVSAKVRPDLLFDLKDRRVLLWDVLLRVDRVRVRFDKWRTDRNLWRKPPPKRRLFIPHL